MNGHKRGHHLYWFCVLADQCMISSCISSLFLFVLVLQQLRLKWHKIAVRGNPYKVLPRHLMALKRVVKSRLKGASLKAKVKAKPTKTLSPLGPFEVGQIVALLNEGYTSHRTIAGKMTKADGVPGWPQGPKTFEK